MNIQTIAILQIHNKKQQYIMAREINKSFKNEFLKGTLKPLLSYIQNDDTLDMELRGDYVSIYYRGGCILSVQEKGYKLLSLSKEYEKANIGYPLPKLEKVADINNYIPHAKHMIDVYVNHVQNHLGEKEIQQLVVKENNYSPIAQDTDYFIIDIEYQDLGRFDIVALRWDSTSNSHRFYEKEEHLPTLTLIEVKQGVGSIDGVSGLKSHLVDFNRFVSDKEKLIEFKKDMLAVFQQKRELGLIPSLPESKFAEKKINNIRENVDFIFLLSNYKSASSKLLTELNGIDNCKFIYSNPMGYGLYSKNIVSKEEFIKAFL